MDNILYRFIADRNTPILDNIERYCISENKDKLTVVRIVFDFLESIKPQLDNSFVRVCMEHIAKDANENTKKDIVAVRCIPNTNSKRMRRYISKY